MRVVVLLVTLRYAESRSILLTLKSCCWFQSTTRAALRKAEESSLTELVSLDRLSFSSSGGTVEAGQIAIRRITFAALHA